MKRTLTGMATLGLLFVALLAFAGDVFTGISDGVRRADSKAVAAYFDTNIQLALPDHEAMYGKAQAEMVLHTFFMKNPGKTFTVKHSGGAADGTQYAVGQYVSAQGTSFRTYFVVRKKGGAELLQEVRFEQE